MLNTFSCAYWPFIYIFLGEMCLFLQFCIAFFVAVEFEEFHIPDINALQQFCVLQIFSSFYAGFFTLMTVFDAPQFFIWVKSNSFIFLFVAWVP